MVDLQDLLGINEGDSTAIRDITAPIEGDDYISSYYKILAAIETNTIHFADTQDQLPQPGDGTKYDEGFIGVAQTAAEDSTQLSLHYYDFDENEWVDTFDTEIITDIQAAIGEVDVEEDGSLQSQISDLDENIGDVDVDSGDSDLQSQIGTVGDFTADNISSQVSTNETNIGNVGDFTADDLSSQVSTNETDIGNVDDFTAGNVSAQVSTNESDIDSLETDLYNGNGDLSVRSADVEQDLTARNIELDNTEMNWGYVGGQNGGLIGYDASTGFFVDYGSSGGGVGKGLGVLLDSSNLQTGANLSISGGESNNSRPKLSAPSIGDMSRISQSTVVSGIESLSSRVSSNESDIGSVGSTDLQTQVSNNDSDISSLSSQVSTNEGDIGNWNPDSDQYQSIQETIGYVDRTDDNLATQIGNVDQDLQQQVDDLVTDVGEVDVNADGSLQSQIDALSSQVSTNETNIGNVGDFTADDLSSQVSTNETNIGNIGDFTADDLSSQVSANEDDIGSWDPDDDKHQSIAHTLGYLDDSEATVVSQLSTLEAIVTNLQGAIPGTFIKEIDAPNTVDPGEDATIKATIYNSTPHKIRSKRSPIATLISPGKEIKQLADLEAGSEDTFEFTWTAPSIAGNYDFAVETDDDEKSFAISVNNPAAFDVSIDSVTDSPEPGDTISVYATIENTGDASGTQDITLDADNSQQDSDSVTLSGGALLTKRLQWATSSSDSGSYTLTVSSDDDSVEQDVTIASPASFGVSIYSVTVSPVAGDTISVGVSIQNTGDVSGTQNIRLDADGSERDSKRVTVSGGGESTETLNWNTSSSDSGPHTLTVRSDDTSVDKNINIAERTTNFQIQNVDLQSGSSSTTLESAVVEATIKNTGTIDGEQSVAVVKPDPTGGMTKRSTTKSINSGETGTVSLSWSENSPGTRQYVVRTESDDSTITDTSGRFSIEWEQWVAQRAASFQIQNSTIPSEVTAGESTEYTATIKNTGDVSGTQTIKLVDSDGTEHAKVGDKTISADSETDVTLSATFDTGGTSKNLKITTDDDETALTTVSIIKKEANLSLESSTIPSTVIAGESYEYTARIKNTGNADGTVTVRMTNPYDGYINDKYEITYADTTATIPANSTKDVTLEKTFNMGAYIGSEYSRRLVIGWDGNYSNPTSITVTESGPSLSLESTTFPGRDTLNSESRYNKGDDEKYINVDETYDYTAKIENRGTEDDTVTVRLTNSDDGYTYDKYEQAYADTTATIPANSTKDVTLEKAFNSDGWYDLALGYDGNYEEKRILVSESDSGGSKNENSSPGNISSVEITDLQAPIVGYGEVTYELTNNGDQSVTEQVTVEVAFGFDSSRKWETLTVPANTTKTFTTTVNKRSYTQAYAYNATVTVVGDDVSDTYTR